MKFVSTLFSLTIGLLCVQPYTSSSSFRSGHHHRQLQYTAGTQPFGIDNFVICRLGTGTGALSTTATVPVFLDEYSYTRNGATVSVTLVRSIALNTTSSTTAQALTLPSLSTLGSTFTQATDPHGQLTLSEDKSYLIIGGYETSIGNTNYGQTSVKRTINRLDPDANIEVVTSWSPASTYIINNVVSDMTNERFWFATQDGGCWYINRNQTSATSINVQRYRSAAIHNGKLYCTRGGNSAVQTFSTNLPTSLMGASSNFNSITFGDGRGMEWSDNDLEIYMIDQGSGLVRMTRPNLGSSTWTKSGPYQAGTNNINAFLGVSIMNDNKTIMVTTSTALYAFRMDALAWANNGASLITASTNTLFRGVSKTPRIPPSPSPTPTISATPSVTPSISNTGSDSPTASITPSISKTPSITPSTSRSPSASITPTISNTPSITPTISTTSSPIDYAAIARAAAEQASSGQTAGIIGAAVGVTALIIGGAFAAKIIHSRRTAARIRKLKQSASIARGTYMHGLDDLPETSSKDAPMTVVYQVSMGPRSGGSGNSLTAKSNKNNVKDNLGAYKDPNSSFRGKR